METISFKIDDEAAKALEERAGQQKGASRHTVARQMVMDALTDANHAQVVEEINLVRERIDTFHDDLQATIAVVCVALLTQAGKVQRPEAEAWVRKFIIADDGEATAPPSEEG